MKNLILGLMITLLSFTAYSTELSNLDTLSKDVKDVATQIDTSQLSKQIYSDVKSALIGLSQGLKVGAEHVYTVLVKQQVVNGIVWIVVLLFGIILLIIQYKCFQLSKWKDTYNNDPDIWNKYATVTLILILPVCISLGIGISELDTIITGLINPEYGAIKEIISFIK